MFKVTVWTRAPSPVHGNKCIFQGEIPFIPRIGESIVVREGFCAEVVEDVLYSFVDGDVEIRIADGDRSNEYGPCIFKVKS